MPIITLKQNVILMLSYELINSEYVFCGINQMIYCIKCKKLGKKRNTCKKLGKL